MLRLLNLKSSSEASESEMCIDEIEPHDPILINQHMLNDLVRSGFAKKQSRAFKLTVKTMESS